MSEQVKELLQKFDSLEKQINLVQNNVNFSLGLTWTILGVVVAALGVAVYFLVKILVNKKVEEELPKAIQNNPPIFYFTGVMKNIASYHDDNNDCYNESYIDIDCTKIGLISLEFPVELNLFYTKQENVKFIGNGVKANQHLVNIKVPLVKYDAFIDNKRIKIRYKEPEKHSSFYTSNIIWNLKVPNPIYKR